MRNWLLFVSSFIFILLISSCKDKSTHLVGYLNPSEDRLRFVNEGNYMIERLSELGVNSIVRFSEDNDALQLRHGYELLDEGVDLLVIAPVNGNTIAPLVRDAQQRGVKVIAYNRLINNADYDLFFTGNNEEIAQMFCEAALSQRPIGNYVVFGGDRFDINGLEVKQFIDKILEPHIEAGRVNLLYNTFIEGWNKERAEFELRQIIDAYGTDIDAIIACSDPMGLGVVEVLKEYGLEGQVIVTGQDAILDAVRSIYSDEMYMTIYHPHRRLGYRVAELAVEILQGVSSMEFTDWSTFNGLENIPTYRMSSVAVTKDNIEEILVQEGEYTWHQIMN